MKKYICAMSLILSAQVWAADPAPDLCPTAAPDSGPASMTCTVSMQDKLDTLTRDVSEFILVSGRAIVNCIDWLAEQARTHHISFDESET